MFKQFSDLSETIQNFLVDATGPEWAKKTVVKFGLPSEKTSVLLSTAERVVLDESLLEILPAIILPELDVDWETTCKIAVDLAGNRLLPLAVFFSKDIEEQIRAWGGDPVIFKDVLRIEIPREDPAKVVKRILADLEIKLPDRLEQSRLEFILTSMVKGERTVEETKAAFMRTTKVGGLALEEARAKLFLDRFLSKTSGLDFIKPVVAAPAPVRPTMFRDIRPPASVSTPVGKTGVLPPSHSSPAPFDRPQGGPSLRAASDSLNRVEGRNRGSVAAKEGESFDSVSSVEKIVMPAPVYVPSPQPSPAVAAKEGGSFFEKTNHSPSFVATTGEGRDGGAIRPPSPTSVASVAFDASVASQKTLSESNESKSIALDTAEILQATQTIKEKISPVAKPILSANDAVEKIVAETGLKLDEVEQKKFVGIVDARLKEVRDAFETRGVLERTVEQGGLAITGLQLARIMELLEEIVDEWQTTMRTEVDKNKQTARENKLAEEAKKISEAKAAAQAAKPKIMPKPITPVLSVPSVVASTTARPVFSDIVPPAHKLSGPIDELQNMTLIEFRRLSSDPKEAKIKIKDKIDLLEEQGMGQKILGIKAWHSAPVSRLYLEITKAALLSGKTIEEISTERSKLGQETLSSAEIKVINELNGSLRF